MISYFSNQPNPVQHLDTPKDQQDENSKSVETSPSKEEKDQNQKFSKISSSHKELTIIIFLLY